MRGSEIRPAFNGFLDFNISFRIHQNSKVLITPLRTGEINQLPTILPMNLNVL